MCHRPVLLLSTLTAALAILIGLSRYYDLTESETGASGKWVSICSFHQKSTPQALSKSSLSCLDIQADSISYLELQRKPPLCRHDLTAQYIGWRHFSVEEDTALKQFLTSFHSETSFQSCQLIIMETWLTELL